MTLSSTAGYGQTLMLATDMQIEPHIQQLLLATNSKVMHEVCRQQTLAASQITQKAAIDTWFCAWLLLQLALFEVGAEPDDKTSMGPPCLASCDSACLKWVRIRTGASAVQT